MAWSCKLCAAVFDKRAQLLEHFRLHHSNFSSVSPLPCLYDDCICTFQSVNALKIHLTRLHSQTVEPGKNQVGCVSFICSVCEFRQLFDDKSLLSHLRTHLKQHEMIDCPFNGCHYRTNVYTSFNAHKSRNHPDCDVSDFKDEVVLTETTSGLMLNQDECDGGGPSQNSSELDALDCNPLESMDGSGELQTQLRTNLASLFLKMHSVLHVSELAIQEIVESLAQIFMLSKPLVRESVIRVLQDHDQSISDGFLHELVEAIMNSNVFVSATSEGAELSTAKQRKTFVRSNYPLVMPVQNNVDSSGHTAVYVPILQMIQTMFKSTNLLDKMSEAKPSPPGMYMSHEDGSYFKENQLLSEAGELKLSLILYLDDLEIANPLGTSRKIHKLCAIYWLLANIPSQYRSSLHVIQLALLCKVPDVERCGYQRILSPLLKDLHTLEEDGIFIESLGQCVRGTVFCVAADNLALCSVSEDTMSADSAVVLGTRCRPVKFLRESLA
ncbi:uncharacterized protein LOC131976671 [Centropristis striata]|uniref:uncharacterized protein LOC131976671 n=1 Tax=Centropristis striata TaxID=184440 RepID=UPI0027E1143C|nr:uncharacterized protein LOC131976671 [Centropristis striata]